MNRMKFKNEYEYEHEHENETIMNSVIFSGTQAFMSEFFRETGQLFYFYNVTETSFEDVEQVPNFYRSAWPNFILFIIIENLILYFQKKTVIRLNDTLTSLSLGLFQECGRLLFRGGESAAYIYIYNYWRLIDLPWNSNWTWYLALLTVDFCYYWVHRASHEIHLFWAQHQVHHSSEEFNIAVGLRQSFLQGWCSFIFYLPLAFFLPPSHFIAHQQFNLIYQVWIHTKTIKTLGPLEYIFNTPQHHRVHHGCNIYCIDKNYGGLFIIWDRLFNTFAAEKEKEEIVYGLVYNEPSFNPFFLQIFYNYHVFNKFKSMKGFKNKLYSIIKGPSWVPGSPWTGFQKDKIDIKTRPLFNVKIPFWCNVYVSVHFLVVLAEFQYLVMTYASDSSLVPFLLVGYIILSLTTVGMILEDHPWATPLEISRCLLLILYSCRHLNSRLFWFIQITFCPSALLWYFRYLNYLKFK